MATAHEIVDASGASTSLGTLQLHAPMIVIFAILVLAFVILAGGWFLMGSQKSPWLAKLAFPIVIVLCCTALLLIVFNLYLSDMVVLRL
ncbi:hypothetical protein [Muricoccus pecuniae]|uniref:Membrane protein YdbS with pleckstrin-like domain n=1 Tax=Muricoccus pecuniae TaxID=693023 RepID=A0A840Y841_9PROT|nr:hypothetical protein [Roseomonas pecuniae]MBB5696306.1 membrane protein YdbS with pleckstrin-like domain [Roseomonas pecuniae]